ncbi:hypothetical protein XENOCAPTIV_011902 [Xenoophorus captivus]|uniref:Bromodomain associated domain-containing protein n=1 Tax=Xenoophorus captivus TaxID=1517983 RepID=A0ABV0S0H2_9TELE
MGDSSAASGTSMIPGGVRVAFSGHGVECFVSPVLCQRGTKAASSPAENYHLARRRTLQVVVSALLTESGFESAEKAAVETLTEMMQSCTYESKK